VFLEIERVIRDKHLKKVIESWTIWCIYRYCL